MMNQLGEADELQLQLHLVLHKECPDDLNHVIRWLVPRSRLRMVSRTNTSGQALDFPSSSSVFKKGPDFEGQYVSWDLHFVESLIKHIEDPGIFGREQQVPTAIYERLLFDPGDEMHKGFDQNARVFRNNLPPLESRTTTALSGFPIAKASFLEFHNTKQTRFAHRASENQTPIAVAGAGRLVLTISVVVGLYVQLLGYDYVQGNLIPTTAIFKGSPPSMFYAFVACIVFAFTGSFNALMLQNIPKSDKLSRLFSLFSVLFLASAFLILLFRGVLLMASLSTIWNMGGRNALFQLP